MANVGRRGIANILSTADLSKLLKGQFEHRNQGGLGQLVQLLQSEDMPASNSLVVSLQETARAEQDPELKNGINFVIKAVQDYQSAFSFNKHMTDFANYRLEANLSALDGSINSAEREHIIAQVQQEQMNLASARRVTDMLTEQAKQSEQKALNILARFKQVSSSSDSLPLAPPMPVPLGPLPLAPLMPLNTPFYYGIQPRMLPFQYPSLLPSLYSGLQVRGGLPYTQASITTPFAEQDTSSANLPLTQEMTNVAFRALGDKPQASGKVPEGIALARKTVADYQKRDALQKSNKYSVDEAKKTLKSMQTLADHELRRMHIEKDVSELRPIFYQKTIPTSAGTVANRLGVILDLLLNLGEKDEKFAQLSLQAKLIAERVIAINIPSEQGEQQVSFAELAQDTAAWKKTAFGQFYEKYLYADESFRTAYQYQMEQGLINFVRAARQVADLVDRACFLLENTDPPAFHYTDDPEIWNDEQPYYGQAVAIEEAQNSADVFVENASLIYEPDDEESLKNINSTVPESETETLSLASIAPSGAYQADLTDQNISQRGSYVYRALSRSSIDSSTESDSLVDTQHIAKEKAPSFWRNLLGKVGLKRKPSSKD